MDDKKRMMRERVREIHTGCVILWWWLCDHYCLFRIHNNWVAVFECIDSYFIYIIHLHWCIGMGHQWCFLWVHEGFRVLQHQTPSPKWPNLLQLPSWQLTWTSTQRKKMTTEMALYIILQQPIRAKLNWWLLNLFKNQEATLLLLFCHNDVVIRLFVHYAMYFFLFPSFPRFFFFTYKKKKNK